MNKLNLFQSGCYDSERKTCRAVNKGKTADRCQYDTMTHI